MPTRGQFIATVVRNQAICAEHFRLVLTLPDFPPSSPGQFVQLASHDDDHPADAHELEWRPGAAATDPATPTDLDFSHPRAYLRRPFSIAGRRDLITGAAEIDIIYRVIGKATAFLQTLKPADHVTLLGPLGDRRGFVLPPTMHTALLVGGGVGIPPMFYLAEILRKAGKKAVAFVGAQRRDLVPLTFPPHAPPPSPAGDPVLNADEFARCGIPTVLTTDDGSLGMKGFVTAALRKFLLNQQSPPHAHPTTASQSPASHPPASASQSPAPQSALHGLVVFCCGPTPMMHATARVCAEFAVPCQVSLEQPMACGMGTCQSCVIRWHPLNTNINTNTKINADTNTNTNPNSDADLRAWKYKLTCTDGPVFDAREIIWDK